MLRSLILLPPLPSGITVMRKMRARRAAWRNNTDLSVYVVQLGRLYSLVIIGSWVPVDDSAVCGIHD